MSAPHQGDNLAKFMGRFMDGEESTVGKYKRRKKRRHDDEAEDKALIRREVKTSALKHP